MQGHEGKPADRISVARLGPNRGDIGLTITDVPNIPVDSGYPYNRLEAYVQVGVVGHFGRIARMQRLEIVDYLLQLVDSLEAFSKREATEFRWGTSNAGVELDLKWSSSLEIRCCVKAGDVRFDRDEKNPLNLEDVFEVFEIVFVVVLPDTDVFLDGLSEIAKFYP